MKRWMRKMLRNFEMRRLINMGVRVSPLLLFITLIQPGRASAQATIERLGVATDVLSISSGVSQVAITALANRVVTAVRTGSGGLNLIAWQVTGNGQILRLGYHYGGTIISQVAITTTGASLAGGQVVTADRTGIPTGNGYLRLNAWHVTGDGQIQRLGDASAGAISQVAITTTRALPGGAHQVVTAVRTGSGNLKLIAWQVTSGGQIQRLGDASAGAITAVAIVGLRAVGYSDIRMLTAVRTGSGYLKLIAWDVSEQGEFERKGDASAGAISQVAMAFVTTIGFPPDAEVVVTAVRTSSGFLEPIVWYVDDYASGQVTRGASAVAGAISRVAACTVRPAFMPDMLVTAVGTGVFFRLIVWDVGHGQIMEPLGETALFPVTEVAVTPIAMGGRVVTAGRTNSGYLQLTVWDVKMSP